jgi:hypothetical protein
LILAMAGSTMAAPADGRPVDTSAAVTQAPVLRSYPPAPMTTNGDDPFARLPTARECKMYPGGRPATLSPRLSRFPREKADNRSVRGDRRTVAVHYRNRNRQQFTVYVSGATSATVADYVAHTRVCIESFPMRSKFPRLVEPVAFDEALVVAVTAATGLSRTELSAVQNSLGSQSTLLDVMSARNVAPAPVLDAAAEAATAALNTRVAAGELEAGAVARLDVRANMDALAALPDPPFVFA